MKTYCVKERKQTESLPNSERYEKAKNGRLMLKSVCANCGITKTRFVSQKGGTIGDELFKLGFKAVGSAAKRSLKSGLRNKGMQRLAGRFVKNYANQLIDRETGNILNSLSNKL